ncbi:LLM class flavin-dependent oxidoreductase [Streptomyces sp. NBC_00568]|uniref:LLM class flavin-dependent oxidoreductase n=1 Tax=Streptomyces sp. NBC_00568 TaxID=2975779 RepID=UPI00224D40EF|nr:LLM class flavin-dependent oxidoreductase [Streptomyces sp. NBC_00568]MCX4993172.1 LLM class flavin-dependent oxidoreductase [Streptomyces sp. NBC_00568]
MNFFPAVDPARKSASTYYDESLQLVELAEELGFAHVRTGEHYGSACGGYSPDPVVFLTAAAAQTRRIRLVAGAAVSPFAHPVQIAARLALLDNLSHGRLDAGFAHGTPRSGLFGVPGKDSAAPVEETAEACIALWSGEEVRFEGDVHRFGPVTGFPLPYQRPHPPVFVEGAASAGACARAGARGHHLQLSPVPGGRRQAQRLTGAYRAARRAAGHRGEGRVQIAYTCYLGTDREVTLAAARAGEDHRARLTAGAGAGTGAFRADVRRPLPGAAGATAHDYDYDYDGGYDFGDGYDYGGGYDFDRALAGHQVLAGTPDDVRAQIETIHAWYGSGSCLSLQFNPGHLPYGRAVRAMELFAAEVAPAFTHSPAPAPTGAGAGARAAAGAAGAGGGRGGRGGGPAVAATAAA